LFQPAQGIFPFPNDLYFSGTTDGTINIQPANGLIPNQVGLNALKAARGKVITADATMQAEAKKRSGPIIEDWLKKASAKGVNAKAILDEFHAELKKVAAERK